MQTIMEILGKRRLPAFAAAVLAALLLAAPPAAATGPAAPTLSATAGDAEVTLTWTASAGADGYQYRSSTDGGTSWLSDWAEIAADDARSREIVVTNAENGTEYTFQVRAWKVYATIGGWGVTNPITRYSEPSNSVTVTPTAAE